MSDPRVPSRKHAISQVEYERSSFSNSQITYSESSSRNVINSHRGSMMDVDSIKHRRLRNFFGEREAPDSSKKLSATPKTIKVYADASDLRLECSSYPIISPTPENVLVYRILPFRRREPPVKPNFAPISFAKLQESQAQVTDSSKESPKTKSRRSMINFISEMAHQESRWAYRPIPKRSPHFASLDNQRSSSCSKKPSQHNNFSRSFDDYDVEVIKRFEKSQNSLPVHSDESIIQELNLVM